MSVLNVLAKYLFIFASFFEREFFTNNLITNLNLLKMKKLALALVCLVSVAFFASCTPEGQPTIQILNDEGYVQNNQVLDVNTPYLFGFAVASSTATNKELTSLKVNVEAFDNEGTSTGVTIWADKDLTGLTSYNYVDTLYFTIDREEILGSAVVTAVVTDAAGQTATASFTVSVNNPSLPLVAVDFDWYRLGNTQTGLAEYGLYWERNAKSPFAQIKPLENVTLYSFTAEAWEATTTDTEKAALFSEALSMSVYNGVDVNAPATYNDVIGTKMADGTLHLLHVTSCTIGAQETQGRPIHIYGQAK